MKKIPKVVVVGSTNTDMVIKSSRIPTSGETIVGGDFFLAAGGKGANQAVAAARLGAVVQFVSKIGSDALGDQAVSAYEKEGIDIDLIVRDPSNPTGVALIMVDQEGENAISVASGANHAFYESELERASPAIREADVLVLQLELPLPVVSLAAKIASRANVPVILDPAPAPQGPLPESLLGDITCIKPNSSEAESLTGIQIFDQSSAERAARILLEMGPSCAIITMGSMGALVMDKANTIMCSPMKIRSIDSTGAGDAFTGAFAFGWALGLTIEGAALLGCQAGAYAATKEGAQPSLPTLSDLKRFTLAAGAEWILT